MYREYVGLLSNLEGLNQGPSAAANRRELMLWALETGQSTTALRDLARQIFNGERRLRIGEGLTEEGGHYRVLVEEVTGEGRETRRRSMRERAGEFPGWVYGAEVQAAARTSYSERDLPRLMSTVASRRP